MSKLPRSKSGIAITAELAEQLADEAEAGYELTPAKRVGRKSLGGAQGTSPRVNFRMTAELEGRAKARAEREGKTVSEIAREALDHLRQVAVHACSDGGAFSCQAAVFRLLLASGCGRRPSGLAAAAWIA